MNTRFLLFVVSMITALSAIQCSKKMNPAMLSKIRFDYSTIDENGLRNGEVAVDYEFCIPANDAQLKEVLKIDAAVKVMKSSKGRIGCTEQQWLCIISTHSTGWKNKLKAIAHLDFVERILETHYE